MHERLASKIERLLMVIVLSGAAIIVLQRGLTAAASPAITPRLAQPLDVVINEIAWSGTISNSNAEWIELKNNSSITVDLAGWRLYSGDGSPNVNLTGSITPGGFFLLERTADTTVNDVPADQIYSGALVDGGESLTLTDEISNVIDTVNSNGGAWPAGTNSPKASMERIDSLTPDTDLNWATNDGITRNGLDVGGNPINGTPRQPNSAKIFVPTPPGSVLISAVHADGNVTGQLDEGFRLTNVSTRPITLTNWIATDGLGEGQVNLTGTLAAWQSIWLARNALAFTSQFGFKPDYEYDGDSDPTVPNLSGTPLDLVATNDELAVREGAGNWIDAVVWGTGQITDTGWLSGWGGPNVQRYSNTSIAATGQILYRKLDEATGQIISDTNTALDWANDRTDPVAGRKAQYPGWELDQLWLTAKVTATAALTVAIAPDNAYRVISDFLGSAQHSIVMEMHTFDNLGLLDVLTRTIGRGVSVTILLEGGPVGGIDDQERWVCQHIEGAGGQCWFMASDPAQDIRARYDYVHAKMIVVDDKVVAIGSENFSPRTLTYDNFSDGTIGHRGVYLLTDAGGVISRALDIWQADFDPIKHRDLIRYQANLTGTFGPPPIGFAPDYSIEVSGYRIRYPQPLTITAPLTFEVVSAPENALHASDALLGWINRSGAGDAIDVEQLDEPTYWGASTSNPVADPNVRLEALIAAAGRGAQVRVLLDRYFDDATKPNSNAATVKYIESLRALSPTLAANLQARLGDPAMYGLHNKIFLFNVGGHQVVHAGSLNGTETSNKVNREVALQVESSAAYAYLRAMFEYDWAFQPRSYFPILMRDYIAPPNHLLISKVFYFGATNIYTGSEWVQIYNPMPITASLNGYKLGDQAQPGSTGFTVDGMWQFPSNAQIPPGQIINVATTGAGFFDKYNHYPHYAFFTSTNPVPLMTPYITYTSNISFSLANTGDEVLLLGPNDQLIDGVAWGVGALPGNVSCPFIDMTLYPAETPNPSIMRSPLWKDTNDCNQDFVIDWTTTP